MAKGQLSIEELFQKVDYLISPMSTHKIIMKPCTANMMGLFMQKENGETNIGSVSVFDKVTITDSNRIIIGGFHFIAFRIISVEFNKHELEEIQDDRI